MYKVVSHTRRLSMVLPRIGSLSGIFLEPYRASQACIRDGQKITTLPSYPNSLETATPLMPCDPGLHPITIGDTTLFLSSFESAKRDMATHLRIDCRMASELQRESIPGEFLHCSISLFGAVTSCQQFFGAQMDTLIGALTAEPPRPILVHCQMGMERSRAFILLFFMAHLNITSADHPQFGPLLYALSTAGLGSNHTVLDPSAPRFQDDTQTQMIQNGRLRYLLSLCAAPGSPVNDMVVERNDTLRTICFMSPDGRAMLTGRAFQLG